MKRLAIGLLVLAAASGAAAAPAASPDLRIADAVVLTRHDGTAIDLK